MSCTYTYVDAKRREGWGWDADGGRGKVILVTLLREKGGGQVCSAAWVMCAVAKHGVPQCGSVITPSNLSSRMCILSILYFLESLGFIL